MGRILYLERDRGVFNGSGVGLKTPAAHNPGVVEKWSVKEAAASGHKKNRRAGRKV